MTLTLVEVEAHVGSSPSHFVRLHSVEVKSINTSANPVVCEVIYLFYTTELNGISIWSLNPALGGNTYEQPRGLL